MRPLPSERKGDDCFGSKNGGGGAEDAGGASMPGGGGRFGPEPAGASSAGESSACPEMIIAGIRDGFGSAISHGFGWRPGGRGGGGAEAHGGGMFGRIGGGYPPNGGGGAFFFGITAPPSPKGLDAIA